MPSHDLSRSKCALIAVGSVLIALTLRTLINLVFNEQIPYSTFFPAVIVTALYCGLYWGLVATLLSALAASFWLVPVGRLAITEATDLARMIIYLFVSVLIVWLADRVRGHRREAEKAAEERQVLLVREQAARKEAERANRAKDEFLAAVTHELRTPLQSILGWTQVLQLEGLDNEQAKIALGSIERSVKIQSQLINDLLDLSRIVMGKLRLDMRLIRLSNAVMAAVETVSPAARAKDIELHTEVGGENGVVLGDPDRLHQVVWNLLSNAIKFTPPGGTVRVRVADADQVVRLTVSDSGEGIDPAFLPKMFERFEQTESGHRKGGLGLGLAIVKELVELHGGSIVVSSQGKGPGTEITIDLPAHHVSAIMPELPSAPSDGSAPRSEPLLGKRVLVVEDDPAAATAIHMVLKRHGAEVIAASSAAEARQLLLDERPNVVLSDLGMPGEDGLQLIRRLRRHQQQDLARIPAVALTASTREEDRVQSLESGFQAHLGKPVASLELVNTLADLSAWQGTDEDHVRVDAGLFRSTPNK